MNSQAKLNAVRLVRLPSLLLATVTVSGQRAFRINILRQNTAIELTELTAGIAGMIQRRFCRHIRQSYATLITPSALVSLSHHAIIGRQQYWLMLLNYHAGSFAADVVVGIPHWSLGILAMSYCRKVIISGRHMATTRQRQKNIERRCRAAMVLLHWLIRLKNRFVYRVSWRHYHVCHYVIIFTITYVTLTASAPWL